MKWYFFYLEFNTHRYIHRPHLYRNRSHKQYKLYHQHKLCNGKNTLNHNKHTYILQEDIANNYIAKALENLEEMFPEYW